MPTHDLVIRAGTVIDGTGRQRRTADVAVSDGTITEVGPVDGRGRREIDADGRLVQPGFVDIHTHYDGQATWDPQLAPSSWHGVTTVIMGNCGVGFAPVRPNDHERLIQLMEGVEDIPGTALHEGLPWAWESFEEYLDFLDGTPHDIDVGAQLPHAAVRLHVMGERGVRREPATADDIEAMAAIARRAAAAGAIGFTTSRTLNHRSSLGELTPTLDAREDELVGIACAFGAGGTGVLQLVSDFLDFDEEFALASAMGRRSGRPVSISVNQPHGRSWPPDHWKRVLDAMADATASGVTMRGQVPVRPISVILGHEGTVSPFMGCPTYDELRRLPMGELSTELRRPEVRARILTEAETDRRDRTLIGGGLIRLWRLMFPLGDPPDYEPSADASIEAIARRSGADPAAVAYDLMLDDDGRAMLFVPALNYPDGNLDITREMLLHDAAVPGLSDGGAHVGTICDVSFPTTLLQWWGRDRPHDRIPLETLVHKQTQATARTVELYDRGVLAPGFRADLNVVDFDAIRLHRPEFAHDLPAGGRRLVQRVDGYDHTFVAGVEVASSSVSTGATPGRLVRGPRSAPAG